MALAGKVHFFRIRHYENKTQKKHANLNFPNYAPFCSDIILIKVHLVSLLTTWVQIHLTTVQGFPATHNYSRQ